jgi:hypothetical protein
VHRASIGESLVGGDQHEVQATLGQTSIKMTSTYPNATTKGVEDAFENLESKRRRQNLRVAARLNTSLATVC